jgi:SpoIID/LytB domain protein
VLYNGQPITTYFSASSGGVTANSADVWGTAFPYLVSVADPYSLDLVLNPTYSHWQRVVNQRDMSTAFNLIDIAAIRIDSRSATNSALTIVATSSLGVTATLPVGVFKTKLKLPSSWFELASVGY